MSGLHPSMSETCLLLNHLLHRNMLHHHLVCNKSVKTLVTGDTTADDYCCIASLTFVASFMVSMCSSFFSQWLLQTRPKSPPALGTCCTCSWITGFLRWTTLRTSKLNSSEHCCRRGHGKSEGSGPQMLPKNHSWLLDFNDLDLILHNGVHHGAHDLA